MTQMPIVDYDFIRQLHRRLFDRFKYVTDKVKHGMEEFWEGDEAVQKFLTGSNFYGDCEEYARTAMMAVRERPSLKVRLIACLTEKGEGHCICEVSNLNGTDAFFFDNRQHTLVQQHQLRGYVFVCASPWNPVPGEERPWVMLEQKA